MEEGERGSSFGEILCHDLLLGFCKARVRGVIGVYSGQGCKFLRLARTGESNVRARHER